MSLDRSQEVNQNYTSKSEEDTDQSQTTLQSPDHLNSQSDQSNNTLVENTERPASEEQPSAFEPPLVENPTETNFEDKNLLRQFQDNLPTCRNFDNSTDSNLLTRDYSSERNCSNLSSNQPEDEHSERSVDAAYLGRLAVGDTHQDSRPNLSDQKSQLENSDCCSRAQFSDSDNEISNDSSADLSFATSPRADHSITERFRESGNPYETSLPEHEQETSAHTNLRLDTKTEDFLSAAVRQATLQFASKREQVKPSGEDNRASVSPRTPGSNFSSTTAGPTHSPRSGNTENPRASVISGNSGYPPSSNSTSPINFSSYYTYSQDENLRDVFYCHLCSYTGNSKLQFNVHMNTHFEHQCPHCDYTSRTEGRLKRHIKDFHSQVPPDNYSGNRTMRSQPGRPKVYKCKQCQFVSPTKVEFWDHSRSHIKEDKILACPKCPFVTEYKHHLEYHLRNHFGSKPFKCPKCNYSCVNKSMLNSHMKSHTNVYQYRCADCTYATKYCHSLKLHLRKYNHQPATVLNADGSLPTDGSGDFELVSKRGPPRGPRGPKKEARSPPPVLNPSILLPHCGPRGMVPSGFWPLLNHLPNGMHPPPPLIPVSGVHPPGLPNPMAIISPPRLQLPQDKISGSQPINSSSNAIPISAPNPYKCNLCEYSTDNREHLNKHMLTVHAAENQDLFNMFGIHTDSLVDEQQSGAKVTGDKQAAPPRPPSLLQEKSIKTEPTGPMVSSAPMIKVETPEMSLHHRPPHSWPMAEEGKGHEETDGSGSQGSNYHTQGDYPLPPRVQSSSPLRPVSPQGGTSSALDLTHSSPREQYNSMLAHSLAATIEQEALQNGECPLDLTKKEEFRLGVLNVGSLAAAAAAMASYHSPLKRPHPDGAANVSPSLTPVTPPGSLSPGQQAIMASSGSDAAPRKRSRKGKAYKLDTICMKLQERDPSPHADSNDDYYSDYGGDRDAGNNSDDESPDQRPDKMESQDSADGYDSADGVSPSSSAVEHKPKEDGPPGADIDYSKIHDSLRELNGTANVETGQELSTYCSGVDKTSPEVHNLGISPQQTTLEHRNSTDGGIPRQDNSALYAGSVSRRKLFVVQQRNEQRLRAEMAQQMANQIASEMTNGWTMEDTLRERDPVTETRNKVVNGMSQKKDCNTFECNYCEIIFKDCVMYTMHMGYHGYHDPFKCNMCGHTSTNKVEFFLHIARAPHE